MKKFFNLNGFNHFYTNFYKQLLNVKVSFFIDFTNIQSIKDKGLF
jgi:hypothetical protein